MTNEAEASAARLPDLLRLRPDAILVGGQALAVWAMALGITPKPPLDVFVTSDVDFLGTKAVARELADKLHAELTVPPSDDPVQVNSAILVLRDPEAGTVLVDFLNSVIGVESSKIKARAQDVEAFGAKFLVMHPVDCLASRIANLQSLPAKQNEFGVAQAQLAIGIVRRFIDKVAREQSERHALKLCEYVGRLARSRAAAEVGSKFGVDVLKAIPVDSLPRAFVEKQWPHLVRRADRRTKPYRKKRQAT